MRNPVQLRIPAYLRPRALSRGVSEPCWTNSTRQKSLNLIKFGGFIPMEDSLNQCLFHLSIPLVNNPVCPSFRI